MQSGTSSLTVRYSLVTPCYNAAGTLGRQLALLANEHIAAPWEMVIVDNGSTDGTLAVAETYADRIPNLRIVDASNVPRSIAHARNTGVAAAAADRILFLDADDEIAPGWLAAMAGALETCGLVGCRIDYDRLNLNWPASRSMEPQQSGLASEYGFLPYCTSCGMGVWREYHDAVGGFDPVYRRLEDIDYCWRVQLATGVTPGFVPAATLHYRLRGTSERVFMQSMDWGFDEAYLFQRFHPHGFARPAYSPVGSWERAQALADELIGQRDLLNDDRGRLQWWKWAGYFVGSMEGWAVYGADDRGANAGAVQGAGRKRAESTLDAFAKVMQEAL
ncbi:MAG: glycosyltransferase [Bacteroidetes bacterium]|nr:glycosyltransferase [Bacteroidota bacterium]